MSDEHIRIRVIQDPKPRCEIGMVLTNWVPKLPYKSHPDGVHAAHIIFDRNGEPFTGSLAKLVDFFVGLEGIALEHPPLRDLMQRHGVHVEVVE